MPAAVLDQEETFSTKNGMCWIFTTTPQIPHGNEKNTKNSVLDIDPFSHFTAALTGHVSDERGTRANLLCDQLHDILHVLLPTSPQFDLQKVVRGQETQFLASALRGEG